MDSEIERIILGSYWKIQIRIIMKKHTQLMAILNVTPDSLFASLLNKNQAGSHVSDFEVYVRKVLKDGADIIDVGGESTGPGSLDVSVDEEWGRIEEALKILKKLRSEGLEFKISVDTYKADVFEKALQYGVDMLNDVTGLRGDMRMARLVAQSDVEVCVMYSVKALDADGNEVRTNTDHVQYSDVIKTIGDFLEERVEFLLETGVDCERIILDPGMGAFVSGDHKYSFEIIKRLRELKDRFPNYRLLIGASRKGFTGLADDVEGVLPVEERLAGSLEAGLAAVQNGADILRVHDVMETKGVLSLLDNFS